jgi:hypothetical protein
MLRKSLKITFFNLTLAGALWAQAQVLDITSPTSGQSISTSDVTVSFTMAAYFAVGDSACADCDGFVRAFLNDVQVASVNSYGGLHHFRCYGWQLYAQIRSGKSYRNQL